MARQRGTTTQAKPTAAVVVFRFMLFWERSILIIKETRARRIKIIEEVGARSVVRRGRRRVTP